MSHKINLDSEIPDQIFLLALYFTGRERRLSQRCHSVGNSTVLLKNGVEASIALAAVLFTMSFYFIVRCRLSSRVVSDNLLLLVNNTLVAYVVLLLIRAPSTV